MPHSGGAMITLMRLDALAPMHLRYGWHGRKNLVTGIATSARTRFSSRRHSASTISDRRSCAHGAHTVLGLGSSCLVGQADRERRHARRKLEHQPLASIGNFVFSQRVAWLQ
jgi:hypothetical protein